MKRVLLLLLAVFLLVTSVVPSFAQDTSNQDNVNQEIEELKRKIADAQSQEKSLKNEITAMDSQIKLTTLQITETQRQVDKLQQEISQLTDKITGLENELSRLSQLLLNRIVTSYKISQVSYLPFLFTSGGITDLLNRAKYLQLVQTHDRQVMMDLQYAKVNFAEQKVLRETKKREQEALKQQLEIQNSKLNEQKKAKQALLEQTQNNEATYQRLLQQAEAEKQAIEAALVSGLQEGPIKKGDPVGLVGNTGYPGCSTGPHLHFEIRKNNQWTDPGNYLKSRTVTDEQNGGGSWTTGSGDWDWPLEGDILVTQHYGETPYSWRYTYSGGIHTGIDLYSNTSAIIRAPKDGILYSSAQNCGANSIIKIKYIDHGDGMISFYLHVQ